MERHSESTKKLFSNNAARIIAALPKNYTLADFMQYVSHLAPATQISYAKSIIFAREAAGEPIADYKETLEKWQDDYRRGYWWSAPTPRESANYVEWSEVLARRDTFAKSFGQNLNASIKYVLLCLYTYLPPVRGEEYATMVMNGRDGENRYIGGRFIIENYKTKKSHGKRIIDVPQALQQIIADFHHFHNADGSSPHLLIKDISPKNITDIFHSIFGRNVSTSLLRKIYISANVPSMTATERLDLARQMGHTIMSQELVYNKKFQ